jgi:hypothetical protein
MTRFTLFAALVMAGCAQQPQSQAPPPPLAANPQPAVTTAPGITTLPVDAEAFEYPADLGGKAVVSAVAPDTPALTPAERLGIAPVPRTPADRVVNPEPVAKVRYIPPPVLSAKSVSLTLPPPVERVPPDLGNGSTAVPARPTLPIAAGITERARDVNLPPAMPTLGRPVNDRVSLDDPTSEFGNAAIVSPVVKVPLAPASFLKVAVPDPFEFGEQVRPKIPPAAEPGLAPVPVNPQRVK